MLNLLAQLRDLGVINAADYYFAKLIDDKQQGLGYSEPQQALAVLLAALCHNAYLQGDSCLCLDHKLTQNFFSLAYRTLDSEQDYLAQIKQKIANLPVEQWQEILSDHVAFSANPIENVAPFVFQNGLLYLYRAWQDEKTVADYLKSAVKKSQDFVSQTEEQAQYIHQILTQYFDPKDSIDWQKIAVATALSQKFCLIAGGPGTGKTYSVARLLVALQQLQLKQGSSPLRIRLAAPTGKAAARLKESIDRSLQEMSLSADVYSLINTESETIHRLLGVRPFEDAVRFGPQNPLPLDVLIVDEASMIDLSMLAKLLRALSENARLILLGDKDQLASVEAGAMLGELGAFFKQSYSRQFADHLLSLTGETVPTSSESAPIRQCLVELTESKRFDEHSPVGKVAKAINQMNAEQSWTILNQEIGLVEFKLPENVDEQSALQYRQRYIQKILQSAVENYRKYLEQIPSQNEQIETQLKAIFKAFNSIRYLTALRNGDFGIENLNVKIAEKLRQQGLVDFKHSRDWFVGKPIMVTQNDINVGLFNGDIGIYLGNNRVYFESGNDFKAVSINRVPEHEMAFSMTIHKSQGSEFSHTYVVLPPENTPILTKELLYTAVTRAKPDLTVFTSEVIWKNAVRKPTQRQSGLGALLEAK